MRQVRQLMGLPISIDIPVATSQAVFELAFDRLRQINIQFSPYKINSEVSKYRRGLIIESQLSPELKSVIEQCMQAQANTRGYFSAWAAGAFDPSGYVKGWAIAEAGKIIEQNGYKTYSIGAGGDILARSDSEKIWNIGIQDPTDSTKILNMLSISNGAVATSGNYERGAHIINPKTKQPAKELASVTITGPDIIWADVLATAAFAMGSKATDFMKTQKDYKAFIVLSPVAREIVGNNFRRIGAKS